MRAHSSSAMCGANGAMRIGSAFTAYCVAGGSACRFVGGRHRVDEFVEFWRSSRCSGSGASASRRSPTLRRRAPRAAAPFRAALSTGGTIRTAFDKLGLTGEERLARAPHAIEEAYASADAVVGPVARIFGRRDVEQEQAHRVDAVALGGLVDADHVAARLRHLLAVAAARCPDGRGARTARRVPVTQPRS